MNGKVDRRGKGPVRENKVETLKDTSTQEPRMKNLSTSLPHSPPSLEIEDDVESISNEVSSEQVSDKVIKFDVPPIDVY